MKHRSSILRLLPLLVVAPLLHACIETTAPERIVEIRVAHASPGLGAQTLVVNAVPLFFMEPMEWVYFALQDRRASYEFRTDTRTAYAEVDPSSDILAIILLDADDPTIRPYGLDRAGSGERLLVIHGDYTHRDPLMVRVERGGELVFEQTVAFGESSLMEPGFGTFDLSVRPANGDDFVPLHPFNLVSDDHGFLVILPDLTGDPGAAFTRILF